MKMKNMLSHIMRRAGDRFLLMFLCLLPLVASANTSAPDMSNGGATWTFTVNVDGTATLTGISSGFSGTLNVPAYVTDDANVPNKYPVTIFGQSGLTHAYNNFGVNNSITGVNFGGAANLTTISDNAFNTGSDDTSVGHAHQLNQKDLDLSACTKLNYIGVMAFHCQMGLTGTLTIPASVVTINGDYTYGAFRYTDFSSIKIIDTPSTPSVLTTLYVDAFSAMLDLTGDVVIPAGVSTIYDGVFRNDPKLRSVTFKTKSPINFVNVNNTTGVARNAVGTFNGCRSLEFIDMSNSGGILLPVPTMNRSTVPTVAGVASPFYNIPAHTVVYLPKDLAYDPSQFNFTATSPAGTVDNTATATGSYNITSTFNGTPMSWSVDGYSTDGGVTYSPVSPAWLTGLGIASTGSGSGSATLTANNTDVFLAQRDAAMQSAAPVSNYDLSTKGGMTLINTANCYVISAPGTYRLPLVYGNAIKDGTINVSAYTPSTGNRNKIVALDNAGANITSPSIYAQGHTATSADIVWADATGLVTNIAVTSAQTVQIGVTVQQQYLTFTVPATIKSGNAVVEVKDNAGKVLWSWHLWFAPQTALSTIPVTNHTSFVYNFTAEPLGYIPGKSAPQRSVVLRLRQGISGKTANVTITQAGFSGKGSNTFYEWGRKDAFPGTVGAGTPISGGVGSFTYNNSLITNANGIDDTQTPINNLATAISNPGVFYRATTSGRTKLYQWGVQYYNLWSNASNVDIQAANDNPVVKTVYDPCPVGFHVPGSNAFTGFTNDGANSSTASDFNVSGSFDKGWNFYTDTSKTNTIFFSSTGGINRDNGAQLNDDNGYFWAADCGVSGGGHALHFSASTVEPVRPTDFNDSDAHYDRAAGNSVRPVAE